MGSTIFSIKGNKKNSVAAHTRVLEAPGANCLAHTTNCPVILLGVSPSHGLQHLGLCTLALEG